MVSPLRRVAGGEHDVRFALETGHFTDAMTRVSTGETLDMDRVWILLEAFFRGEMHRQTLVPGAVEALGRIGEVADIVILTNLGSEAHAWRVEQLASHGIRHDVVCNSGGKGTPVQEISRETRPSRAAFVDDLPIHHASVAKHAPEVWRLHMIAEPKVAQRRSPAEHAHARIDDWPTASDWILERFTEKE